MVNNRIYRFDNLKVFMILGIVMEHALLVYGYPRQIEIVWALMISWLMPLFTIISGYWYKKRTIKEYANNYLKPMLVISAVNFLFGFFFYSRYSSAGAINVVGYAMWYLVALFIFTTITNLLIEKINIFVLLILSFIVIFCYAIRPTWAPLEHVIYSLSINRYVSFYPFYLLGILYSKYEHVIRQYMPQKYSIIIFALSMLCYVMLCYVMLCYVMKGFVWTSGFYLGGGNSIVSAIKFICYYSIIGVICLSLVNGAPEKKYFFTQYGSRTMNVYLLHMIVVFFVSYGMFSHFEFTWLNCTLNVLLCIAICCLFFSMKLDITKDIKNMKWVYAVIFYILSLMVVNKSYIYNLLS